MGDWLSECGSVSGLCGVFLWLGGCRAMAESGSSDSSASGVSWVSRGPEVVNASEVWGGRANP